MQDCCVSWKKRFVGVVRATATTPLKMNPPYRHVYKRIGEVDSPSCKPLGAGRVNHNVDSKANLLQSILCLMVVAVLLLYLTSKDLTAKEFTSSRVENRESILAKDPPAMVSTDISHELTLSTNNSSTQNNIHCGICFIGQYIKKDGDKYHASYRDVFFPQVMQSCTSLDVVAILDESDYSITAEVLSEKLGISVKDVQYEAVPGSVAQYGRFSTCLNSLRGIIKAEGEERNHTWVLRTRPDLGWFAEAPFPNLTELDRNFIYVRFRCLGITHKWINSNLLSSEIISKIKGSTSPSFEPLILGCALGEFRIDDQFALVPGNLATHYFGTNYQYQLRKAKDDGWACPCCHFTYLVLNAGAQIKAWPFYFSLRDNQRKHENATIIPSSKALKALAVEATESVSVWQHDKFPEQNCSSQGVYSELLSNFLQGAPSPTLCFEVG